MKHLLISAFALLSLNCAAQLSISAVDTGLIPVGTAHHFITGASGSGPIFGSSTTINSGWSMGGKDALGQFVRFETYRDGTLIQVDTMTELSYYTPAYTGRDTKGKPVYVPAHYKTISIKHK